MKEKLLSLEKKYGRPGDIYYIPVVLGYLFTLVMFNFRPGVFSTLLLLVVTARLFLTGRIKGRDIMDRLILVYLLYNIISGLFIGRSSMSFSVFTGEFVVSILPVIFYFSGRYRYIKAEGENAGGISSPENERDGFYRMFTISVLIIGIAGIILYIWAPDFYIDYSYKMLFISKADVPTMRVRMNSTIGCTLLGFLGVAGMLTGACGLERAEDKKRVARSLVTIVICLLIAVLSNQRSAMVGVILVIFYLNYLAFFKLDLIDRRYLKFELIAMAAVFILLLVIKPDILLKIWYRLRSLPLAVSERSEQWIAAINNMHSTWFGNGPGANGHRALGTEGAHVIADGGLIKLYCEEGIIGFSLFLYIVISGMKKGLFSMKKSYVSLGIAAITLLESIGSNIIAFQLSTPVFWYAIGALNREDDPE